MKLSSLPLQHHVSRNHGDLFRHQLRNCAPFSGISCFNPTICYQFARLFCNLDGSSPSHADSLLESVLCRPPPAEENLTVALLSQACTLFRLIIFGSRGKNNWTSRRKASLRVVGCSLSGDDAVLLGKLASFPSASASMLPRDFSIQSQLPTGVKKANQGWVFRSKSNLQCCQIKKKNPSTSFDIKT